MKPTIWIIDTSILLNVLDVPQFNQDRDNVLGDFRLRIRNEDTFLLPFTSILETGNHIAHINNDGQRLQFATKLKDTVSDSIKGNTPWKPLRFPDTEDLIKWLDDFPHSAQRGVGLGDHVIIKQWEEQCEKFKAYVVKIWSLDKDLRGYECNH
ncbi:MAG TPA: hypothetical protein PKE06_07295 [Flavilitoribacter sp.]|nr:hypothetical protein [Flavilitoribacter sp.]HMQ88403.1 hypothetical protein [Flavilitoribacter sp.]